MQTSEIDIDRTFKIIILGDSQVGKTSILKRYTTDDFTHSTRTTIGADFDSKIINHNDKMINLNIWDTAGQEIYRAISNQYYRQASGVLIVFDVTSRISFENIKRWMQDIRKNCDDSGIIKLLIGNKVDKDRLVTADEAEAFASKNKMGYIETSALSNMNIELAFQEITRIIMQKFVDVEPAKYAEASPGSGNSRKISTPKQDSPIKKHRTCCSGRDYSQ